MTKRKKLDDDLQLAVNLKNQQTTGTALPQEEEKYLPKSVNLRKSDWRLLRLVARARADRDETRDSVSKVVESLIDASRKALEAETKYL